MQCLSVKAKKIWLLHAKVKANINMNLNPDFVRDSYFSCKIAEKLVLCHMYGVLGIVTQSYSTQADGR